MLSRASRASEEAAAVVQDAIASKKPVSPKPARVAAAKSAPAKSGSKQETVWEEF